jgi:hypothetical protein
MVQWSWYRGFDCRRYGLIALLSLLFLRLLHNSPVALSEYPHIDVEVYEGATQIDEIGAGIGFFPRGFFS